MVSSRSIDHVHDVYEAERGTENWYYYIVKAARDMKT